MVLFQLQNFRVGCCHRLDGLLDLYDFHNLVFKMETFFNMAYDLGELPPSQDAIVSHHQDLFIFF